MIRLKVVLAEPQPIYMRGLVEGLRTTNEIELVATCTSLEQAVIAARTQAPEIVVTALHFPGCRGVEAVEQFVVIPVKVIVLTSDSNEVTAYQAVRRGADGYLLKDDDVDLIDTIKRVHAGEIVIAPRALRGIISTMRVLSPHLNEGEVILGVREREVLRHCQHGRTTAQVAKEMQISPSTVKMHLRTAYQKLGVHNRAAAIAEATRQHLL